MAQTRIDVPDSGAYGIMDNEIVVEIKRQERERILNYLLAHGYGGGNFRRLIEALKNN